MLRGTRLKTACFAAALLLAACAGPPSNRIPSAWRFARVPPPVEGAHVMVATEHPLASDAGAAIMRQGGNAIDAAVAASFVEEVVNPRAGNIGGGGFLVYRQADGQVTTLDYRETAPGAASRDMYVGHEADTTNNSLNGALASGVPGAVAGLWAMHQRFGRLPWRAVLAPAIRLASEGHVVDSARAAVIHRTRERLALFPASAALYLPGGEPLAAGATWIQPDLAATLGRIADSGAAGFYRGRTADLIVAAMRRNRGIITKADLAAYQPVWRDPIRIDYRGWTIYSMPPSSSGGVTMAEMFNILEGAPLPRFGSPELLHLEIEAMRRAFIDRNYWLGDPAFVQMPMDRLLSKAYAERLREQIDPHHASPTGSLPPVTEGTHTTQISIVDSSGNAVSITTTLNDDFGSALAVDSGGFVLNDEMDDFATRPGEPNMYGLVQGEANAIAPGKRMLSAMTPSIVLDPAGRLALVLGAPGGPRIITAVMQVISNVIDHHMDIAEAVYAPRIHHQALPDSVRWEEGGIDAAVRAKLVRMGHAFYARPGGNAVIEAIQVTPRGLEGVTDPRIPSRAAGW